MRGVGTASGAGMGGQRPAEGHTAHPGETWSAGAAPSYITPPLRGSRQIKAQPADFPVGGHGCTASRDGAALLPDERGNPDKQIGTYQKEAMHAPCNILATLFPMASPGPFFVGRRLLSLPGSFKSLPPLRGSRRSRAARRRLDAVGGDGCSV